MKETTQEKSLRLAKEFMSNPPESYKQMLKETAEDMAKGSKWNHKTDSCEYEDGSWCKLPKFKHCKFCMRLTDGTKACELAV